MIHNVHVGEKCMFLLQVCVKINQNYRLEDSDILCKPRQPSQGFFKQSC